MSIVIYHGGCIDGMAAAWAFNEFNKESANEYIAGRYQSKLQEEFYDTLKGQTIYFLDFSVNTKIMSKLVENDNRIYLLDHHKTAINDFKYWSNNLVDTRYCDLEKSGCMIAWDFSASGEPPKLFKYIQDRDLWKFEFEETEYVTEYLYNNIHTYQDFSLFVNMSINTMVEEGKITRRVKLKNAEKLCKNIRHMYIAGHQIPIVNAPYYHASDIGNILSKDYPAAGVYWDTEKERIFSLRSTKENPEALDVSELCRYNGGGGHKHAAGFSVPRDHELAKI